MVVKKPEDLPYRPGVGIMLINKSQEIFAARRIDTTGEAWQMPQGGIDEGETAEQAALRELEEEAGTGKAKIIKESADWFYYDLPPYLIGKLWGGKYRGQKQKWFLMKFTGSDSDIDINTANPEFCEWRWMAPDDMVKMIVEFKRELYKKIIKEFLS